MKFLMRVFFALFSPTAIANGKPRLMFLHGPARFGRSARARWFWVHPNGRFVPVLAGGDPTATAGLEGLSADQLVERRNAVLSQLEDDAFDGDVGELVAEAEAIQAECARRATSDQAAEQRRRALLGLRGAPVPAQARRPGDGGGLPEVDQRDIARMFVECEAFLGFRANGYKGKTAVDVPVGVRELRAMAMGLELRAPMDNAATSAGAFQNPARPAIVPMSNADRPVRLADLIDRQNTGDNTVEYVRDTTAAGAGDTAAEVAEGSNKPEAAFTFEVVTDSVRTVAHWVQITRQAADDNEQVMGYIRGRLTYGLEYRLDGQIINGNGTSPNLRGILNTTGINTRAPGSAEARVITIRKAITDVQVDEYAATAVVLHPTDWELVELSTDTNGMFRVSPNVSNALAPRIWGLSVVSTTAIAAGTGLVGDFRMGATLWDRRQTQLFITDSHASTFIANVLTLLAELRVALSVWRPAAFCKITFNGTT